MVEVKLPIHHLSFVQNDFNVTKQDFFSISSGFLSVYVDKKSSHQCSRIDFFASNKASC